MACQVISGPRKVCDDHKQQYGYKTGNTYAKTDANIPYQLSEFQCENNNVNSKIFDKTKDSESGVPTKESLLTDFNQEQLCKTWWTITTIKNSFGYPDRWNSATKKALKKLEKNICSALTELTVPLTHKQLCIRDTFGGDENAYDDAKSSCPSGDRWSDRECKCYTPAQQEEPTPTEIGGCTDISATNFNSEAEYDDGSCEYGLSFENNFFFKLKSSDDPTNAPEQIRSGKVDIQGDMMNSTTRDSVREKVLKMLEKLPMDTVGRPYLENVDTFWNTEKEWSESDVLVKEIINAITHIATKYRNSNDLLFNFRALDVYNPQSVLVAKIRIGDVDNYERPTSLKAVDTKKEFCRRSLENLRQHGYIPLTMEQYNGLRAEEKEKSFKWYMLLSGQERLPNSNALVNCLEVKGISTDAWKNIDGKPTTIFGKGTGLTETVGLGVLLEPEGLGKLLN